MDVVWIAASPRRRLSTFQSKAIRELTALGLLSAGFLSESTDFRDRLQCVPPVDRNRRPVSMLSGRKKDLFLQVCSVGKNSALKAGHLMQLYNPAVCLPVLFARSW